MIVLGIDSSSPVASAAVVSDEILRAEYSLNLKKTHSEILLPMIDEVLRRSGIDAGMLDGVAVSGGPGSFTGLRIGSATAMGLAEGLGIPIINIPTLEALAFNVYCSDRLICPMMDARRLEVYAAAYRPENGLLRAVISPEALPVSDFARQLNELGESVLFLGDGVPVAAETLEGMLKIDHKFTPLNNDRQRAGSVAALGIRYLSLGMVESPDEHRPVYLRKSQAERERDERKKHDNPPDEAR